MNSIPIQTEDEKAVFVPFEEIRSIEYVLSRLERAQKEFEKAVGIYPADDEAHKKSTLK